MARLHRAARQGARYRGHKIAGPNEPKVVAGRGKWKELFSLFLPNFKILFLFTYSRSHTHKICFENIYTTDNFYEFEGIFKSDEMNTVCIFFTIFIFI